MFSFNPSPTTEIYTLSLHDALPICDRAAAADEAAARPVGLERFLQLFEVHPFVLPERIVLRDENGALQLGRNARSEEHTSELQSRRDLVCRLLLEKKKESGSAISCD